MTEQGPDEENLSVPMWVWTLLGFVLLTAVVIVVLILGGGKDKRGNPSAPDAPPADAMPETLPATTMPETTPPAATQPA